MAKLAAFPKCYMDQLCVDHTMTIFQWIDMASTLDVDGLEFYSGFVDSLSREDLIKVKRSLQEKKLEMPMMCYSPNFTNPDSEERRGEIKKQNAMVDLTAELGGKYCRSCRQGYPDLSRQDGINC
jgi:sugar phosphate isomerase/epimerase